METSSKNNNTVSEMFINFFGFDNYKSILQIIINYAKAVSYTHLTLPTIA